MDLKTNKQKQAYVDIVMQLDSLRSGKFVNPTILKQNLEHENFDALIREKVHDWDSICQAINNAFEKKMFWIKLVDSLRWLEIPMFTAYLSVVALALFRNVPWAVNLSSTVTMIVFVYLLLTRLSMNFMVDNQAKKLTAHFKESIPRFDEKIRRAINLIIEQLDSYLLDLSEGGIAYRMKFRHTDYPGVTYIMKPSRIGPELLDAYPFPLHVKLSKAKTSVRIFMSRRDDKLIQALAEVPQSTNIEMVVLRSITSQKSWSEFAKALKKTHPRFTLVISDSEDSERGVQVLLSDSIWKLDMRESSGYLRLPYLKVEDDIDRARYEELFSSTWLAGETQFT